MLGLCRVLLPHASQRSFIASRTHVRHIHPTVVALKKKRLAASTSQAFEENANDDPFVDSLPEEDELFAAPSQSSTASADASPVDASLLNAKSPELLQRRAELFERLHTSTLDILNKRGKMRQPPRKSTVVRLTALSETKEDLERVLEVIIAWRSVAHPPNSKTCDEFIGRCTRLKQPEMALRVLKDRPKYGIDLTSLDVARRLLHALSIPRTGEADSKRALVDCLALAELYPLYNLPPASTDVVSCAILASVIARQVPKDQKVEQEEGSDDTMAIALEGWHEILLEFEKAAKGWGAVVDHTNPKAVQWLFGSIRKIRSTVQPKEERTRAWLKQFRREIRLGSSSNNLLSNNASV